MLFAHGWPKAYSLTPRRGAGGGTGAAGAAEGAQAVAGAGEAEQGGDASQHQQHGGGGADGSATGRAAAQAAAGQTRGVAIAYCSARGGGSDAPLCAVATAASVQLWMGDRRRARLAEHTRRSEEVAREGDYVALAWRPRGDAVAALTEQNVLHIFRVDVDGMYADVPAPAPGAGSGMSVFAPRPDAMLVQERSLRLERLFGKGDAKRRALGGACCTALAADDNHIALGRSDGVISFVSWDGAERLMDVCAVGTDATRENGAGEASAAGGAIAADRTSPPTTPLASTTAAAVITPASAQSQASSTSASVAVGGVLRTWSVTPQLCVVQMDYNPAGGTMGVVLSDGRCAILQPATGAGALAALASQRLKQHWLVPSSPSDKACFVRAGGAGGTVALGCLSGNVDLFRISADASAAAGAPFGPAGGARSSTGRPSNDSLSHSSHAARVLTLGLSDWGVRPADTGAVSALSWAPGGRCVAVGWRRRGCAVWSASGCRLMSTIRQLGVGGSSEILEAADGQAGAHAASARLSSGWSSADSCEALDGGVADLAWGQYGYDLLCVEATKDATLVQLSFARSPTSGGATSSATHTLLGSDRVIEVSNGEGADAEALTVQHHVLPSSFVSVAWPMRLLATSSDGTIAVAGSCGLAIRRQGKWRLFGDARQERELRADAIAWLGHAIAVATRCAASNGKGAHELRLYPRYHLDARSCMLRMSIPAAPLAMEADASGRFLLLAVPAEDDKPKVSVRVYEVAVEGELSPAAEKPASATLTQLSCIEMDGGTDALACAYIMPNTLSRGLGEEAPAGQATRKPKIGENVSAKSFASLTEVVQSPGAAVSSGVALGDLPIDAEAQENGGVPEPTHCLALRTSGVLVEVCMADGSQRQVASEVESVWLSDGGLLPRVRGAEGQRQNLMNVHPVAAGDIPWWLYGPGGMQVYFPEGGAGAGQDGKGQGSSLDAELDFDREVYPIGVSAAGAVVGVCQRTVVTSLGAAGQTSHGFQQRSHACLFEVCPRGQPVLPCLLRHLISKGALSAAMRLAVARSGGADFSRSLEWLLYAALDAHASALAALTKAKRSQQVNGNPSSPGGVAPFEAMEAKARLALTSAADLVAEFDQALDVIVSVARKTDADQRKALFEACGNPGDLFTVALHTNRLRTAGCYLLVVSELDGAAAGRRAAEELLHKTLEAGGYDFALEIVRFLLRAGREEDLEAEELARGRDGTHTEASGDSSNGTRAPKQRTWWGWFMGEPAPAAATARRRPLQGSQRQRVTEAAARVSEGAVHRAVRLAVERHWQAAAARAQQRAREATPSANGSGEPDARAAAEARAFRDEALELLDESSVRG